MSYQNYGEETNAPQGGKNKTPGIRETQKGCNGFADRGCSEEPGQSSDTTWHQPQRVDREIFQREGFATGSEIIGGTFSQLIEDCERQIAGNNQIIGTLQGMNESLKERIDYYQQLMEKISESQE